MRSLAVFAIIVGVATSLAFENHAAAQTNLVMSGGTMTLGGRQRYDNVCLTGNATIQVPAFSGNKTNTGNLELIAGSIYIGPNVKIVARGKGYQPALCSNGGGPNTVAGGRGGCSVMDSGGGGAHFGRGGRGTVDRPDGNATWQSGFPTAFEDDCNIGFDAANKTCRVNQANTEQYRTFCWQNPLHTLNSTTADQVACGQTPCVGASVAGVEFWHSIYDSDFGAAGGDKGCRDGDGRNDVDP
ncbi:MAG: hypothetical protein ABW321_05985, partial [Polyangiales bacterium]